ncbi:MAG: hypothetical protein LQ346_001681 [Caloplaca aetnensis]|nr:MAG: hypothetical protein LQ346_001681 [Caloplaca aetnensis]
MIETFACSMPEYLFLPVSYYQATHLVPNPSIQTLLATPPAELRLMIFAFSLAGAYQLTAFAHLYRKQHGTPLPAKLIIFDCSPAIISRRTTTAMMRKAVFLHARLPGFFKSFLQILVAVSVTLCLLIQSLIGKPDPSHSICKACNNPNLFDVKAKRLYLYTAADEWIPQEGIEQEIVEAERKGWVCVKKRFEGVKHCQCVRKFGTYLEAVAKTWVGAVVVHENDEEGGSWR